MWGQQKPAGEASMYPKLVQDLSGWRIRSIGCWLVYHERSNSRAFYNMYKFLKQLQSNLPLQPPVLKGHLSLVLSHKISCELNLF